LFSTWQFFSANKQKVNAIQRLHWVELLGGDVATVFVASHE
jgi:hypothetical protein